MALLEECNHGGFGFRGFEAVFLDLGLDISGGEGWGEGLGVVRGCRSSSWGWDLSGR